MQPRPESRIAALEKRTSAVEASIEELSSDTAEELKAIRHDIKQLDDGMRASFLQIGDAFNLLDGNIETVKQDVETLKRDVETVKQDVETVKRDVETVKQDVASIKDDMAALKAAQDTRFDEILQLLQQK